MVICIPEAMGKGKALTDHERGRILGLHEAGLTGRAIAHAFNRSQDTVLRIVSGHVGVLALADHKICPIVHFERWFARQRAEISQQHSCIISSS